MAPACDRTAHLPPDAHAVKVISLKITPVAMHDQPLMNSTGVHESQPARTIAQVETDEGVNGIGETGGDRTAERKT